jgi:hypothetical protein
MVVVHWRAFNPAHENIVAPEVALPSLAAFLEGAAANRIEAAHVSDQTLPDPRFVRHGILTEPVGILVTRVDLLLRRLRLRRRPKKHEREHEQHRSCHCETP